MSQRCMSDSQKDPRTLSFLLPEHLRLAHSLSIPHRPRPQKKKHSMEKARSWDSLPLFLPSFLSFFPFKASSWISSQSYHQESKKEDRLIAALKMTGLFALTQIHPPQIFWSLHDLSLSAFILTTIKLSICNRVPHHPYGNFSGGF